MNTLASTPSRVHENDISSSDYSRTYSKAKAFDNDKQCVVM